MRGVLLDSAIIPGGAATVRLNLVPALARYCSRLTWAWPFSGDRALHGLAATVPNLRFEPLVWPAHHPARWADAALRRLPAAFSAGFVVRRRQRSAARLVKRLTRELDAQFLLTTCIFGQAAPETDCPVFGILCDVNPSLPDDVFSSMDEWVRVSDRIFAISEFTRAQAAARWPAAAAKFVALPLAPDSE